MGNGASINDPSTLNNEEKQKFVESMLHGEVTDLAATFAAELDRIKSGAASVEDVKEHMSRSLSQRRQTIANRIEQREKDEITKAAAAAVLASSKLPAIPESEAEYAAAVALNNINLARRSAKTFIIGVDGSVSSDMAFQLGLSMRRKHDNIILFHTFKSETDESTLMPQYRSNEIRAKFEALLVGNIPSHNYFVSFLGREPTQTAKQALINVIDKARAGPTPSTRLMIGNNMPDFLIIGFSGRKSEMENRAFLGSKTDLALRHVHIPVIVSKRALATQNSDGTPKVGKSFVFAVAATETSRKGLDILLTIVGPKDDLTLLHVKEPDMDHVALSELERTQLHYEKELHAYGPVNSRMLIIDPLPMTSPVDRLVDYVNDELNPDFLVVAPRAQQTVSSITEQLILKSRTNVILCKT